MAEPLSGPGILISASHIIKPSELSDEAFNKWYNEVHIPDVLATGGVSRATRFRNASSKATEKYLVIYEVDDLSVIASERFKNIPFKHKMLPGGGDIHDFVNMEIRFYKKIQTDPEGSGQKEFYPALLWAGVGPGEGKEDDYDAYMRQEHLPQFRSEPGWRRSTRYKLAVHAKNPSKEGWGEGEATSYIALYEFDEGNKLGSEVQPLDPMTDWTKRIMAHAKKFELGIFHKI
ncbi:hypothetical protein BT63DRAFT_464295 [Microthyrium microscopicum]|uniref:EthD domain-containing protein n=1 Tax=Microthyrium microscopicum TaxID=703497 RepID=A0A6A6TYV5_9PEZI|nr:hypothetical protein BT63DRAFT_464295 [Microthyrium microscopicum]